MAYKEKRGNNSWRLVVDIGTRADGSRDREYKTIKVEDEALLRTTKRLNDYLEDQLKEFKQEVLTGRYVKPEKTTLQEFVDRHWEPKYAKSELEASTLVVYQQHLNGHILPRFGHMKMEKIQPMHIVDFLAFLKTPDARKDGRPGTLGNGTQRYILRVLRNVFARAAEWKFVPANPCDGAHWPKKPETVIEVFDEDEIEQIISCLRKQPTIWKLMILGAFFGGFRRGELVAVELSDIDFGGDCMHVRQSIPMKIKRKPLIKGPKNKSSKRTVSMPEWYMRELEAYCDDWEMRKELVQEKWKGGDQRFVFHTGFGEPYHPNTPTAWWRKFLKENGFRHVKLHGLRHTSATFLLEQGATVKAVQERLGHSSERTTSGTYLHVTKKYAEKVASEFDRFDDTKQNAPISPPTENQEA